MSERYRWPTSRLEVFSMCFKKNKISEDKDCMLEYLMVSSVLGDLGFLSDDNEWYKKFTDIDKRFRVDLEKDPANFKGRIFVFFGEHFYEIYNSMKMNDVVSYTDLSSLSSSSSDKKFKNTYNLPVMMMGSDNLGSGIIFNNPGGVIVHRDSGNSTIDDSYLDTVRDLYSNGCLTQFDDSKYVYESCFKSDEPFFKFTIPGFYHSLMLDGMVITDSKPVRVEVKWFMTTSDGDDTDVYICGELSVISEEEGGKSLLLKTPRNKAIRVSHGQPIPLLKSIVAVPYYQDFTFSASLGCPDNIDDSALYFPTVNASVTFFSDSEDEDEDEDDPGLGTLEEEEEVPVLDTDTHEDAASVPCKFYVFRKVIYGTGGFLEVKATVDMQ